MKLIQCPAKLDSADLFKDAVFMAGGISNCPLWHLDFIDLLKEYKLDEEDVVVFNPRRDDFDVSKKEETVAQITWEQEYIEHADIMIFWFPKETLCPITLFELGTVLYSPKHIIVGCHPEYARRFDLEVQLPLARPGFKIHDNLNDVVAELRKVLTTTH